MTLSLCNFALWSYLAWKKISHWQQFVMYNSIVVFMQKHYGLTCTCIQICLKRKWHYWYHEKSTGVCNMHSSSNFGENFHKEYCPCITHCLLPSTKKPYQMKSRSLLRGQQWMVVFFNNEKQIDIIQLFRPEPCWPHQMQHSELVCV